MNYGNAQPVKSKRRGSCLTMMLQNQCSGVGKQRTEVREQRSERLLDFPFLASAFCHLTSVLWNAWHPRHLRFINCLHEATRVPTLRRKRVDRSMLTKPLVRLLWQCLNGC